MRNLIYASAVSLAFSCGTAYGAETTTIEKTDNERAAECFKTQTAHQVFVNQQGTVLYFFLCGNTILVAPEDSQSVWFLPAAK